MKKIKKIIKVEKQEQQEQQEHTLDNSKQLSDEEIKVEKSKYTRKIEIPIYEPKNKCPHTSELYDTTKRDELQKEIESDESMDELLKDFLMAAAERHTSFNFSKIADYYSHIPIKYKKFFENSSLVIIDYDNAIRNGFISYDKEVQNSRLEYLESLSNEFLYNNREDAKSKQDKKVEEELEHLKKESKSDDISDW